ncbi:YdhK family protein [Psychrobacillus antarcticus]|uniref:YdhK family protein n=1 Tax=Psychrobacillus antarcticus TaxID=2879115 RepID=UPI002407CCA0|nr:YdhK family protein [Psychrobacillus antarcticus]
MRKKLMIGLGSLVIVITLSACAGDEEETTTKTTTHENMDMKTEENKGMDHSNMDMSGSGEVPTSLKVAENPTFEVGSQAIIETDHMEGMKGAEATIVGAYDTTVYTVSYTPTTGGERVENHKWVIHEELGEPQYAPLEPGSEVVLIAGHMEGMEGATAEIDSAEETTVYMVDFTSTTGDKVTNHKWVTESELSPTK